MRSQTDQKLEVFFFFTDVLYVINSIIFTTNRTFKTFNDRRFQTFLTCFCDLGPLKEQHVSQQYAIFTAQDLAMQSLHYYNIPQEHIKITRLLRDSSALPTADEIITVLDLGYFNSLDQTGDIGLEVGGGVSDILGMTENDERRRGKTFS